MISIPFSTIKSKQQSYFVRLDLVFQFHLVRLKDNKYHKNKIQLVNFNSI